MTGPRYLRAGWPTAKVAARHRDYATTLIDAGVIFEKVEDEDRTGVEDLVNARLFFDGPYSMATLAGGILATHGQSVAGAVVVEAAKFDNRVSLCVTALAVTPEWEGKGLGTVLLGMAPQLVPAHFVFGGCAPDAARFYQRAGFDVLAAGELLPFPFGGGGLIGSTNRHYPAWFFRST